MRGVLLSLCLVSGLFAACTSTDPEIGNANAGAAGEAPGEAGAGGAAGSAADAAGAAGYFGSRRCCGGRRL